MLKPAAIAIVPLFALLLAGCTAPAAADPATDGVLRVVASTNVYGDLAATVGGADVEVTSIIDDPAQDPHQFEANGRVQLALSRADVVVLNGGGYDDFVTAMLEASGNTAARVVEAVEVSGRDPGADGFNEHVWYDYGVMIELATTISIALADVQPPSERKFTANTFTITGLLQSLGADADLAASTLAGTGVIVTEPVPLYLLDRMGLDDLTPAEFSEAIEEDTDVSPSLLQDVLNRIGDGSVALVVYNAQTGGPLTEAVLDAAAESGVPAVAVTETLPAGKHYTGWQRSLQDDIIGALAG